MADETLNYQKIYEIKKAEKLLEKHSILENSQKQKNNSEISKEQNKGKEGGN